jgi:PAS domain S-box-containing protein
MGGINQSLFLIGALFVGQGAIPGQGSAAVVLLGIGLLLSWAATPGWVELILMYPNRVGGIAATCAEAFRPYSPVLANLTGVCYWWGWVPTCGLTALLAASAINQLYLPWFPVAWMATGIVLFFTFVNLCGVKWVMRLAMPIATASASLAFLSATIPVFCGKVSWHQAFTFHLTVPFPGYFGQITSVMAGLYLIGFAAPAFEQAACHVGETINPKKNVPRAMFASAGMASLYFVILPVVWLGTLGPDAMGQDLAGVLGPTFAPLLGGAAKAVAVWFMVFNMLHGTIAGLAGASRTLAQLSADGLLPEFLAKRSRTDAPWTSTILTAGMSIAFLWIGDPVWLIAAANLTYLIGIAMPNVAVWLLRRNEPDMERPYRAPRGTIMLGLLAAMVWGMTTILGFQQFGLPTVLVGITFAYSGSALYAWRKASDRRKVGLPIRAPSLHLKLTGAMLLVLTFDAFGYLIAVSNVPNHETALLAVLSDIFVAVALLTIGVGLILPGMIAHAAVEVSKAANQLVQGTLADFTRAMEALASGDLNAAKAQFNFTPVTVHCHDEVGAMAESFNKLQVEIGRAAVGLEGARKGLSEAREHLEMRVQERTMELSQANQSLVVAHKEMKASEHRLRMILETEPECVALFAEDGALLEINPAGLRLYEAQKPGDIQGHVLADLTAKEFRGKLQEVNAAVFRGESVTAELRMFGLKGTLRWVTIHACPLRDLDGRVIAQLAVTSNITERKRAEDGIARSLALLRATLESTADGILTMGPTGRVESYNQTFLKMWDISEDLIASKDDPLVSGPVIEQLAEPELFLAKVRELYKHRMEESSGLLTFKDGRSCEWSSRPMMVEGRPSGRVWSFRDTTERKRAEANLEKAHRELLAASRLAGMAEVATGVLHNVGNVLNSVNVSATLLRDNREQIHVQHLVKVTDLLRQNAANLVPFLTQDPRGQRLPGFLEKLAGQIVAEQANRQRELEDLGKNIEHIREIVALQQGYATVSGITEPLEVSELIEEALRMNESTFGEDSITVVRDFKNSPPVAADRHKVLQILVNLIRNAHQALLAAAKPEKILRLVVSPVDGNGHVRIKVCDNGPGVATENLNQIFQHGFTTKKDGHGYGLHSSANAAKAMGGRLQLEPGPAGGETVFVLELPMADEADPAAKVQFHN